jgi:diaminopimelate epimerase
MMPGGLAFTKMHGIGNDFVVLDRRDGRGDPLPAVIAAMADRHTGIGFDQLMVLTPPRTPGSIAGYRIYNTDGTPARQCGNGVRCLVAWLQRAGALDGGTVALDGPAGTVACRWLGDGRVRVDMGVPDFDPAQVPFVADGDADAHAVEAAGQTIAIGVVAMGNPHAVLVVDDVASADVAGLGPTLERHPRFPDRANVGFAAVTGAHAIDLRVYERGVGETRACGSGACAAAAVLIRRGRVSSPVDVRLPGGTLAIDWAGPGTPLAMTGATAFVFDGTYLHE